MFFIGNPRKLKESIILRVILKVYDEYFKIPIRQL